MASFPKQPKYPSDSGMSDGVTCLACSTRASCDDEIQLLLLLVVTTAVDAVLTGADDVSSATVNDAHVVITLLTTDDTSQWS